MYKEQTCTTLTQAAMVLILSVHINWYCPHKSNCAFTTIPPPSIVIVTSVARAWGAIFFFCFFIKESGTKEGEREREKKKKKKNKTTRRKSVITVMRIGNGKEGGKKSYMRSFPLASKEYMSPPRFGDVIVRT